MSVDRRRCSSTRGMCLGGCGPLGCCLGDVQGHGARKRAPVRERLCLRRHCSPLEPAALGPVCARRALDPGQRLFREQLDATGAAHNAATYVDWVRYHVTATRDEIDTAVMLMAGALREPLLDASELEKEIRVVLDEFDLRTSSHSWRQRHVMLEVLFGDALPRLDALGSRKAVRQATPTTLRREHASRYRPGNAVLVLTGDIDRAEARRIAKRHFGDWPAREAPAEALALELVPLTRDVSVKRSEEAVAEWLDRWSDA